MDLVWLLKKGCSVILAASGVWVGCVLLCSFRCVQRQVFYAHNVPIWWGQKLDQPETFGFLKNQVTILQIPTKSGNILYAWLVSPLGLYAQHEAAFQNDSPDSAADFKKKTSFSLLTSDPESRLVIYFHGNAGTVGQTRRTDAYRMISSGASDKIHVLAFDYSGFGKSTGSPSEECLIKDAISIIEWAMDVAGISPDRIVLLAQSLGTGLASAAASHFANAQPKIEFAGVILCASFTNASSVFLRYSIGGKLPLLAPIRHFPMVQTWFTRQVKDTWRTSDRVANLVRRSDRLRLTLFHATSDNVIPWNETNELFYAAVNATASQGLTREEVEERQEVIDLGEGGWVHAWSAENKVIRKEIVRHGGK